MIPEGYEVEHTDERVTTIGTRLTRWGAWQLARRHHPRVPSYHLRVERGGLLRWEVVAYQNRLIKV